MEPGKTLLRQALTLLANDPSLRAIGGKSKVCA
jgi:hypothetical protein